MSIAHRICLAGFAIATVTSCTTRKSTMVMESSLDSVQARYTPATGVLGHREKALIVDDRPMQMLISSKFIELDQKTLKGHDTLTDPQFQIRLRRFVQMKGVDLMTAPSVVAKNGQRAKVEIVREMLMKGSAYDEQVNLGVTLDIEPQLLKDGRIHLSGKATVRELDTPEAKFDGNTALSVQSTDTFFDTIIKDGRTVQLICRDKDTGGQRVAFITARLIDPAGQPINKR